MKNFVLLALTVLGLSAFAADDIVVPKGRGQAFLKAASGDLFPLGVTYTTDGAGHIRTLGGQTLVADNLFAPKGSGKAYLKDSLNRLFPAQIIYTTDGNGHPIPFSVPAPAWGEITGTLGDQTDLSSALALKANASAVSNVNNTSDANKPVSTAQQAALDLKQNILPVLSTLHVDKAGSDSVSCGSVANPCLTIQQALTNIGDSTTAAQVKQPKTVMIGPGAYDESITIPRGRILTLVAQGTVVLGNGTGSNWASTTPRSVTANFYSADVFGSDIKPALNIVAIPASDATSTFIAEAGVFLISGNLVVNGDGLTNTVNTSSVKVTGTFQHISSSLTNWQSYRSIFTGAVTTTGNLVLERAYDSRFNALVSINAYNMVANCNFAAGMTVQSIQQNALPNGMFFTNFAGTFTGPASSLRLDPASNYYFSQNNAVLAGGATKVMLGNSVVTSLAAAQPACSAANRGMTWNVDGGAGVADTYQVCQKNAADAYAWATH